MLLLAPVISHPPATVATNHRAAARLIYNVTGSCGMQQHDVVKKPPYPSFTPSLLILPSLHLLLPHIQFFISHLSLISPGFLYHPYHFLFYFLSPMHPSKNEKSCVLYLYLKTAECAGIRHVQVASCPTHMYRKYRCILSTQRHAG